jgi:hypothetical protein
LLSISLLPSSAYTRTQFHSPSVCTDSISNAILRQDSLFIFQRAQTTWDVISCRFQNPKPQLN